MSSNECIHYEACKVWAKNAYIKDFEAVCCHGCERFKHNALYIKPPCRFGDEVYIVDKHSDDVITAKVVGLYVYEDKISLQLDNGETVTTAEQLGKSVFLELAEAEKATGKKKPSFDDLALGTLAGLKFPKFSITADGGLRVTYEDD